MLENAQRQDPITRGHSQHLVVAVAEALRATLVRINLKTIATTPKAFEIVHISRHLRLTPPKARVPHLLVVVVLRYGRTWRESATVRHNTQLEALSTSDSNSKHLQQNLSTYTLSTADHVEWMDGRGKITPRDAWHSRSGKHLTLGASQASKLHPCDAETPPRNSKTEQLAASSFKICLKAFSPPACTILHLPSVDTAVSHSYIYTIQSHIG